ncbi:hypothetical protein [Aerosakkonema funiforme]|uniref:hypothetical protein n=1 Tax=Aerosakkonema funiforme TaxID=1246630 RepID=UPI0035BAA17A
MSSQLTQNQELPSAKKTTLFDRTFRDSEGKIVIAQIPNLPFLVGLAATLLQFLLPSGKIQITSELVAFGALFTWAWLELFEGVNYFRRALGLIVLVGIIVLKLNGSLDVNSL